MSKAIKAVGNVISSVVKGVVNAVVGVVKAVVNVVASVINFVAQPFMGMLGGMPDAPSAVAEAQRQQGVLIQQKGSTTNIPVVYGFRKVGSVVTFAETGSTNNQYLWVAHVLSEGVIEGLYELFLDDVQLPNDVVANLNAGRTVDIATGKYSGRVKMQFFNGTYYSTPSTSTVGTTSICKDAPSWKSTMVYNGLAVVFARYEWKQVVTQADSDNNPFGGDIPQLQACILGRKIASLVITNPESYSYANAPVRYSTNPAEILLDYLRNPYYGKGLVNDDIDWTTWRRAASKCNQVVTYVTGVSGNIMTCNHVVDTGQTIFANVKTLLMGFRAYMPYVQGKYKLKIEDAGSDTDILSGVATIVATFNKDNIQGNVTYTGIERSNKYNQVVVTYVDPDQKWSTQQVIYPESESERQTYIALDGGRENKLEATFPTLTNYAIAKDMARLLFNKSRIQESCSLTVSSQAMELEPGDNIYIQSNLLNFTTTPWRIIQTTLNDDMTYDLACVRNPDTIYPHTRHGEEDIVLPTYVPRGATIYFPTPNYTVSIGLVPPTTAPIVGTTTNPTTNPPPTTPGSPVVSPTPGEIAAGTTKVFTVSNGTPAAFNTGFDHGFVGNGREELVLATTGALPTGIVVGTKYYVMSAGLLPRSFRLTLTPGGTTAINTSSSQSGVHTYVSTTYSGPIVIPIIPPVVPPLPVSTVIDVTNITYETVNGFVRANVTWLHPSHANYAGVDFWYKRYASSDTVFLTTSNTQRPGIGLPITHKIENLFKSNTQYELIGRVKFTTGESSTFKSTVFLNVGGAVTTENPQDYYENISGGWTPNTTPLPAPKNIKIDTGGFNGLTVYSAGIPANPRSITWTFKQDVNAGASLNFDVDGINIYYKGSTETKWTKTTTQFANTYVPGTQTTITFPGDLGVVSYPSVPGASDNYDFIFRFKFKDGTDSTEQLKVSNVNVEYQFGSNVNIVTTQLIQGASETLQLVDPAVAADARNITVTLNGVNNTGSTAGIRFFYNVESDANGNPTASANNIWGIRLYYRKIPVSGGDAGAFTVVDHVGAAVSKPAGPTHSIGFINSIPVEYDQEYQYVLIPLVRYPSSTLTKTEAYFGHIGRGKIHNRQSSPDYPIDTNWLTALQFRSIESSTIPGVQATAFPRQDATVRVVSWNQCRPIVGSYDNTANTIYYELIFDTTGIANFSSLFVYRRINHSWNPLNPFSQALYTKLGRFEKIPITLSAGTHNATSLGSNQYLVNLRLPTSWVEFNSAYPSTATAPNTTSGQTFLNGLYTDGTVIPAGSFGGNHEYYLCVNSGASPAESTKIVALPMPPYQTFAQRSASTNPVTILDRSAYNGFVAGYQRNMSEARSRVSDSNYMISNYLSSTRITAATRVPSTLRGSGIA